MHCSLMDGYAMGIRNLETVARRVIWLVKARSYQFMNLVILHLANVTDRLKDFSRTLSRVLAVI